MLDNNQKKVIVGMSGGVDSSVSAYLLQQQGYQVAGLFMKNWEEDDNQEYCAATKDLQDAQAVCNKLGIKLHTVNFSAEYWDNVFTLFLKEYQIGRTPNPDILCNKEIKFNTFLIFATEDLGADYIATGHYVRHKQDINGKSYLLRGLDNNKDQSYFLYTLSQSQIVKSLFPLGELKKLTVRRIAEQQGLATAKKKDSTGICFIGKRKFRNFLRRYLPIQPGPIVSVNGKNLGRHEGLMYHTLGQRKGLRIGGIQKGNKDPWYVVDKNIAENILLVAQGQQHPRLMSQGFIIQQLHLINPQPLITPLRCTVKIRYRQQDIPCTIMPKPIIKSKVTKPYITNSYDTQIQGIQDIDVYFDYPVAAVTPGQSAVFYQGEICLGGSIIKERLQE
ncbi:tRNA 2-thiouridine(34) synthase MnmA [Candidatus Fukatsuia anoeciicola]|uniref:tRNA 2-thiouridine(34) synthase MnmA n=1 Tax=Candidatus Fukatsuia anoeciicola TaxID=2994492 RepID=UPI0034647D9E